MTTYTPLTDLDLLALAALVGATPPPPWRGPALPRPTGAAGLAELFATVQRLAAYGEYLVQAKDGMRVEYEVGGRRQTAERLLFGSAWSVQQAAGLEVLLALVEKAFGTIEGSGPGGAGALPDGAAARVGHVRARIEGIVAALRARVRPAAGDGPGSEGPADADPSSLPLEAFEQYAMTWTTFEDVYRRGLREMPGYVRALTDRVFATDAFWPALSDGALPFNLLVLARLDAASAGPYRDAFGARWTAEHDAHLAAGTAYGIDMTIFAGLAPQAMPDGSVRFTPCTRTLLLMDGDKRLRPAVVSVADPRDPGRAEVYTGASDAWIYALTAVKTSLTVYGIWIGHVYTLHLVTAAVSMATWNELEPAHVVHQMLAPQSNFTIPFDLVLLLGWSRIAPPTSIGDFGKFIALCAAYAAGHDFFSTDPHEKIAALGLDPAAFTGPDGEPWGLYPDLKRTLHVWDATSSYVGAVVGACYASDAAVRDDDALQRWAAAAAGAGNVVGLPALDGRAPLGRVLTSLLFRVNLHGSGRIRSVNMAALAYVPNFPPCLQSTAIPPADAPFSAADLLSDYLPRTDTLAGQISFYGTFAFMEPVVPFVPYGGPGTAPFFGGVVGADAANAALAELQERVSQLIAEMEPAWVQTGQWPLNIEL